MLFLADSCVSCYCDYVKFIRIDPPGTWCHHEAVFEMIQNSGARSFLEVGCGAAELSYKLCKMGLQGVGIDFSPPAIRAGREKMREFIDKGLYSLVESELGEYSEPSRQFDVAMSMMVMEHVEDDVQFLKNMARHVRPGGHVLVAVPGRRDRWGIEDETVGHFRRYDRQDLKDVLKKASLSDELVWSVAVPVANILFHIGNFLIRRTKEVEKRSLSMNEQTQTSGIREIPFKTVFPAFFSVVLNRYTLYPLFLVQRLFYRTGLGLTMLAIAKVDH